MKLPNLKSIALLAACLTMLASGSVTLVFAGKMSGSGTPTAVSLNYFIATGSANGIDLEWETATEFETAGFKLYRSTVGEDGPFDYLSELGFISAEGGSFGAKYNRTDIDVNLGQTYWYQLVEVETDETEKNVGRVVQAVAGSTPTATPAIFMTATSGSQSTAQPTNTNTPTSPAATTSASTATQTATATPSTPTPTAVNDSGTAQPSATSPATNTPIPLAPTATDIPSQPTQILPTTTASPIPIGSNPTATPFNLPPTASSSGEQATPSGSGTTITQLPTLPPGGDGSIVEAAGNPYPNPNPTQSSQTGGQDGAPNELQAYPAGSNPEAAPPLGVQPNSQPNVGDGQNVADATAGGNDSSALPNLTGDQGGDDGADSNNLLLWGGFCAGLVALLAGIFASLTLYKRRV